MVLEHMQVVGKWCGFHWPFHCGPFIFCIACRLRSAAAAAAAAGGDCFAPCHVHPAPAQSNKLDIGVRSKKGVQWCSQTQRCEVPSVKPHTERPFVDDVSKCPARQQNRTPAKHQQDGYDAAGMQHRSAQQRRCTRVGGVPVCT